MSPTVPDLQLAMCLLILFLPVAVTGQARRLSFSIQPNQGKFDLLLRFRKKSSFTRDRKLENELAIEVLK